MQDLTLLIIKERGTYGYHSAFKGLTAETRDAVQATGFSKLRVGHGGPGVVHTTLSLLIKIARCDDMRQADEENRTRAFSS
jgi:hypothetical protein